MSLLAASLGRMTDGERFRPDEQPSTTRERLIAEGLRAFTTSGFDGTSLRDVERRAGVSRGLVAHHFGTKDELWRECVNWLMQRFHDEMARIHRNLADVSSDERARVLLKVYVRFVAHHPEFTRLTVMSGDDDSERMRWMVDTWIRPNQEFFNRMSGAGQTGEAELEAMWRYAFVGAASLIFTVPVEARLLYGVDPRDPEFIERFADGVIAWVGQEPPDDAGRVSTAVGRAMSAGRRARR